MTMTTTVTSLDDIRSRTLSYNARWLATDATSVERLNLLDALLVGVPTRTLTVSRIGLFGDYGQYRVAITEGIYHAPDGEDGSFYAAEDPRVKTCQRRDNRQSMTDVARRVFGQNLPDGWQLRIINHD